MKKVVHKHRLSWVGETELDLHVDSEILSVQIFKDEIFLWESHRTDGKLLQKRFFNIFGTGEDYKDNFKHISTVLDNEYALHVFEKVKRTRLPV